MAALVLFRDVMAVAIALLLISCGTAPAQPGSSAEIATRVPSPTPPTAFQGVPLPLPPPAGGSVVPPPAWLIVDDEAFLGTLGSYETQRTLEGGMASVEHADVGGIPAPLAAVTLDRGQSATIIIAADAVPSLEARFVDEQNDADAPVLATKREHEGDVPAFGLPAPGNIPNKVLAVSVSFSYADVTGSTTYYWRVTSTP